MIINEENKTLIKEFNRKMLKEIGCEFFQVEYKYKEKNLFLNRLKDTGILTKTKKRQFVVSQSKAVFDLNGKSDYVDNEEIYLYLSGMMDCINMITVFSNSIRLKMEDKITPGIVH